MSPREPFSRGEAIDLVLVILALFVGMLAIIHAIMSAGAPTS